MTSNHDASVDTLQAGDVVLFTGNKHVQGIREIGTLIRDTALGDALGDTHPDRGSYSNVYSLRSFLPSRIPLIRVSAGNPSPPASHRRRISRLSKKVSLTFVMSGSVRLPCFSLR
jgi:hypothetical protein